MALCAHRQRFCRSELARLHDVFGLFALGMHRAWTVAALARYARVGKRRGHARRPRRHRPRLHRHLEPRRVAVQALVVYVAAKVGPKKRMLGADVALLGLVVVDPGGLLFAVGRDVVVHRQHLPKAAGQHRHRVLHPLAPDDIRHRKVGLHPRLADRAHQRLPPAPKHRGLAGGPCKVRPREVPDHKLPRRRSQRPLMPVLRPSLVLCLVTAAADLRADILARPWLTGHRCHQLCCMAVAASLRLQARCLHQRCQVLSRQVRHHRSHRSLHPRLPTAPKPHQKDQPPQLP